MSHLWMRRNSCRRRGEPCQAPLKHAACLNPLASPLCLHTHTYIHTERDWLIADKCGLQCSCNPDPDKHRHHHTFNISWTYTSPTFPTLSDIHTFSTWNTPFFLPCSWQNAAKKSFRFYQVVISLPLFFLACQISDLSCHSKPWPHENTIVQQPEDGVLHYIT